MKKILVFSAVTMLSLSCTSTKFVNTSKLPDTYQCTYMKDICKEAREFESTYNAMSPEEKKEFVNIMKAYKIQCNDALDACQKSNALLPEENK